MSSLHAPLQQSNVKRELIAIWGYAQRNYFLTRRYFLWEVVWLVYSIMNALTIGFIGVCCGQHCRGDCARHHVPLDWHVDLELSLHDLRHSVGNGELGTVGRDDRIHLHEPGQPRLATDRHGRSTRSLMASCA